MPAKEPTKLYGMENWSVQDWAQWMEWLEMPPLERGMPVPTVRVPVGFLKSLLAMIDEINGELSALSENSENAYIGAYNIEEAACDIKESSHGAYVQSVKIEEKSDALRNAMRSLLVSLPRTQEEENDN